jgi:membrane associated rhomboid family serine protease
MIPLYDTARSHRFPLVNLALILANILVFLYELQMGSNAAQSFMITWGLVPARLISDPNEAWKTIYTSMFLHGGWLHVVSNMWVLFIFGDNVEARMGKIKYLIFYLLSGTAAGLLQTYILPTSQVPMVGASGAIAGVLGAYLVFFPRSRVASIVPIFFIFTIVEIPAFIFLIFWFFSQIYSGLFSIQGGAGSGIAWWAHIGGFLFGLVMSFFFANRRRPTYYRSY